MTHGMRLTAHSTPKGFDGHFLTDQLGPNPLFRNPRNHACGRPSRHRPVHHVGDHLHVRLTTTLCQPPQTLPAPLVPPPLSAPPTQSARLASSPASAANARESCRRFRLATS